MSYRNVGDSRFPKTWNLKSRLYNTVCIQFKIAAKDITEKPCNGKTVRNDRKNDRN